MKKCILCGRTHNRGESEYCKLCSYLIEKNLRGNKLSTVDNLEKIKEESLKVNKNWVQEVVNGFITKYENNEVSVEYGKGININYDLCEIYKMKQIKNKKAHPCEGCESRKKNKSGHLYCGKYMKIETCMGRVNV